jgi:SAM-dependent methyltransferase
VDIFDCEACGCRFVEHDAGAHEALHAHASSYTNHARYCADARDYYGKRDAEGLRRYLAAGRANRFVIEFVDARPRLTKVAEVGCSLGYLLSYFALTGRDAYGFDVSRTAVAGANAAFGPHFFLADQGSLDAHAPYDVIFHVGTVGCVADPVGMTEGLLALLNPGGWLLFNAPNRRYLDQTGEVWLGTPPPDLVSIFPETFWAARFQSLARLHVDTEYRTLYEVLLARRRRKASADRPKPVLGQSHVSAWEKRSTSSPPMAGRVRAIVRATLDRVGTRFVDPYGVMVAMQRRPD